MARRPTSLLPSPPSAREGAAFYVIPGTVAETGQARAADVLQMQSLPADRNRPIVTAAI
ncbi:hypothetical protein ABIE69_003214 [Rhodobacteraceae bacterium MBR-64]